MSMSAHEEVNACARCLLGTQSAARVKLSNSYSCHLAGHRLRYAVKLLFFKHREEKWEAVEMGRQPAKWV